MATSASMDMTRALMAQAKDPVALGKVVLAIGDILGASRIADAQTSQFIETALMSLIETVASDVRQRLALRIAAVDWAPHALVVRLAHDEIQIAGPVLRDSLVLTDPDLLSIAETGTRAHRQAIAVRPAVSGALGDALTELGEAEVLLALLENGGAALSLTALTRCITAAQEDVRLHAPLCGRSELSRTLAAQVYAVVGGHLQTAIAAAYNLDERALRAAIADASDEGFGEREADAAALVDKLEAAGRLVPAIVARAAADGRIATVEHALARLSMVEIGTLRATMDSGGAYACALACRAARVDRAVYADIAQAMRAAGKLARAESPSDARTVANVFSTLTPTAAADALRQLRPAR